MKEEQIPIKLRTANQEDVAFIFNAWLKSYKSSYINRSISPQIYYAGHHKLIEKLLKSFDTLIACSESDPAQIFGFINAGFIDGIFCVNYIYVKHTFRNLQIAQVLLNGFKHSPEVASVYTHHTRAADHLAPRYNMVYHPYLLFDIPNSPKEDENDLQ